MVGFANHFHSSSFSPGYGREGRRKGCITIVLLSLTGWMDGWMDGMGILYLPTPRQLERDYLIVDRPVKLDSCQQYLPIISMYVAARPPAIR